MKLFHNTGSSGLSSLRNTLTEVTGCKGGVSFRNHPGSKVGNEIQTLQGDNGGNKQIACREENLFDIGEVLTFIGDNLGYLVYLYADDDVKEQQNIKTDEIEHSTVEMDGKISREPLRPSSLPFRQEAKRPLDRSEDGKLR